jgi:UDP-2,3-diacylglucosamine pyrophosphatase LpxH
MPTDRVVLISDVHMDEWDGDLGKAQADRKRHAFLGFLQWIADNGKQGKIERFLINGDLLDVPQQNRKPLLPLYADVMAGLANVLAAGVRLAYVIGNHDSGVVGLTLKSDNPPITIAYPYMETPSAGKTFIIEHGHLHDPWLWDYVRQLGQAMWTKDAPAGGAPIFTLAGAKPSPEPEPGTVLLDMDQFWQGSLQNPDLPADRIHWLRDFLSEDLKKDYSTVLRPDLDGDMIQAREELGAMLAKAPAHQPAGESFAPVVPDALKDLGLDLVHKYLSGPMWRQAAVDRLTNLATDPAKPLAGIVMGHTHFADDFMWHDGGGDHLYVNSGSWRHDAADLVVIDAGHAQLHRRKWTDSLPVLP